VQSYLPSINQRGSVFVQRSLNSYEQAVVHTFATFQLHFGGSQYFLRRKEESETKMFAEQIQSAATTTSMKKEKS
jgi:hypothetical protein